MRSQLRTRMMMRPLVIVAAAGLVAGSVYFAGGLSSPERMLAEGYAPGAGVRRVLLDEVETAGPRVTPAAFAGRASGDGEGLRTGVQSATHRVLGKALVVGSRVEHRADGEKGPARQYEVLDVEDIDAPVVGMPGVRLQVVLLAPVDSDTEAIRKVFMIRDKAEPQGKATATARGRDL